MACSCMYFMSVCCTWRKGCNIFSIPPVASHIILSPLSVFSFFAAAVGMDGDEMETIHARTILLHPVSDGVVVPCGRHAILGRLVQGDEEVMAW